MQKILYFIILFIFIIFTNAATAELKQRGMLWMGADVNAPFKKKSQWSYDIFNQIRLTNSVRTLEQFIFRPSISYRINNHFSVSTGYDFIPTIPPNTLGFFIEQRTWPQLDIRNKINSFTDLATRTRFEFRFNSKHAGMGIRLRQSLGVTFLNTNKYNISFSVFDEIFLTLKKTQWISDELINQNRIFAGLIIPMSKDVSLNTGYLNIYRPRPNTSFMDHVFVVSFVLNFDPFFPTLIRTI